MTRPGFSEGRVVRLPASSPEVGKVGLCFTLPEVPSPVCEFCLDEGTPSPGPLPDTSYLIEGGPSSSTPGGCCDVSQGRGGSAGGSQPPWAPGPIPLAFRYEPAVPSCIWEGGYDCFEPASGDQAFAATVILDRPFGNLRISAQLQIVQFLESYSILYALDLPDDPGFIDCYQELRIPYDSESGDLVTCFPNPTGLWSDSTFVWNPPASFTAAAARLRHRGIGQPPSEIDKAFS